MDTVLRLTYEQILEKSIEAENLQKQEKEIERDLSAGIKLIRLIMIHKAKLDKENQRLLQKFLPTCHECQNGCSWEDTVEANLVFALRTCLAKSEKETHIPQHIPGKLKDVSKLEK